MVNWLLSSSNYDSKFVDWRSRSWNMFNVAARSWSPLNFEWDVNNSYLSLVFILFESDIIFWCVLLLFNEMPMLVSVSFPTPETLQIDFCNFTLHPLSCLFLTYSILSTNDEIQSTKWILIANTANYIHVHNNEFKCWWHARVSECG